MESVSTPPVNATTVSLKLICTLAYHNEVLVYHWCSVIMVELRNYVVQQNL